MCVCVCVCVFIYCIYLYKWSEVIQDTHSAQISQKQDGRNMQDGRNIYVHPWYIYSIWYKLINFSLLLNPAIQRMGNTHNILHPRRMEQDESHLHFIFYCKLSKVTLNYISELIKLNYSFNLPFKFSFKTIKMGSFSILWRCTFKNSTHTFRSDTHASLQSLSWRWIW